MAKLIQLIYMSAAAQQFDSIELTALLANARQKNQILNVSGMLVYHDNSFLQVLEGEASTVDSLYALITWDPRHTNCKLLLRSSIDRRDFGDWTMGFINTKLYGPTSMPGYNDFFGNRFSQAAFANEPSLAHKLLLAFRAGNWRQTVETNSAPSTPAAPISLSAETPTEIRTPF